MIYQNETFKSSSDYEDRSPWELNNTSTSLRRTKPYSPIDTVQLIEA